MIHRSALLRLEKFLEALGAKFDLRVISGFRDSIGVKQTPITSPERQLYRRIGCLRELSKKQSILEHSAHALGGSTPQQSRRVTRSCVRQRVFQHVDEQIRRSDEMVLELSTQRLIQAQQHLCRIGSV